MALRPPVIVERAVARTFLALPPVVLRRIVGPPRRSPEGLELDLEAQALLRLMAITGARAMHDGGVERARRRLDREGSTLDPRGFADVETRDLVVPCPAGPRAARAYRPAASRGVAPSPALVFFHGGGFTLGSLRSHDGICRALASKAGVVVIAVDYRLAPEHPFPAAVEDAVEATRWVLDNAASLGVDPSAVAVGGDSAGGTLATVAAQMLRDAPRRPAFQLLMYPATDATRRQASHRHFAEGLMLASSTIDWFLANYFPSPSMTTDPRASPLFAHDVSGLPPALVLTAGFDPLRDEGKAYADRMRAAGVDVEYVCSEGSVHGFMNMAGVLYEPARMLALAADRLARALTVQRAIASAA